jgi:hypothetical protein
MQDISEMREFIQSTTRESVNTNMRESVNTTTRVDADRLRFLQGGYPDLDAAGFDRRAFPPTGALKVWNTSCLTIKCGVR